MKTIFFSKAIFSILVIFYPISLYILLSSDFHKSQSNFTQCVHNELNSSRLTHVVIPLNIKQIDRLKYNILNWKKYFPCTRKNYAVKLVFFFGIPKGSSSLVPIDHIKDFWTYQKCFSSVNFVNYEFSNNYSDSHVLGSRLMFEHMLAQNDEQFKDANYIFYMEPDCRPIKMNWLDALARNVDFNEFWMKGSIYRGNYDINYDKYLPNKYHINGNAIYNIGNKYFREFYFKTLRPYIEKHGDSTNAYDTDFFEYIFDLKNYDKVRQIIHNFVFTDTIQNCWHSNYNITEINILYSNTYLVHGGNPSV
jgi:hypothetical protein